MAATKITLSQSRDIPFDKLVLSQSNVRRIKAGVSIEELAEDIARRGLLQGLSVRPVIDAAGAQTGMFEIPAGGRRFRALDLLVKGKRLAKTAPVPCIVREGGIPEEDSLAENIQRAPLHPLDQFRAFLALREKGQSEEEIAAAFFVSVSVVRQRLKLASVSPALLNVYAEDGMTLDQLMAFTVSADHERQAQVFERLAHSYDKHPYMIRRMLTEGSVRASDKRAQFIGVEPYIEAGGQVLRDLFESDDGGWLEDVALVGRLVAEKLERETTVIRAEGWKWVEVAPDFPYGHTYGLRRLRGEPAPLTVEEEAARDALRGEFDRLVEAHADVDDLPEEIDARLAELDTAIGSFDARPPAFDPVDIARAGAFVSIAADGALRVERGFVRPEDEQPLAPQPETSDRENDGGPPSGDEGADHKTSSSDEPDEDEGLTPISDRLLTELTAFRTVALREAVGRQPEVAFLAALHALTLKVFYPYGVDSCLELQLKNVVFGAQAPDLAGTAIAETIRARHDSWARALPEESEDLWDALGGFDSESRSALFAYVVSVSVNAAHEAWNRRPRALAHADQLARAAVLDVAGAGWAPTIDNYLGRVTKARILAAVAEAKGQRAADRIEHLKKGDMAAEAQCLLEGANWIPEPLRTPGEPDPWRSSDRSEEADAAADETDVGLESGACDASPAAIDAQAIAAE